MRARLGLTTRIGVAILVSLTLVTAGVTAFVVGQSARMDGATSAATDLAPVAQQSSVQQSSDPQSSDPQSSAAPPESAAKKYVQTYFLDGLASQGFSWDEQQLADLLPNRSYSTDGSAPAPLASGIVVGTIADVTGGGAYSSPAGKPVDYATEPATARVVVLHLAVEQGLGEAAGLDTIDVGLKIAGDVDPVRAVAGLRQFGRVIVVLDHGVVFPFDASLPEVRRSSALLGTVDAAGKLDFPFLGSDSPTFLGDIASVTKLVAAAQAPSVTRPIVDGRIVSD